MIVIVLIYGFCFRIFLVGLMKIVDRVEYGFNILKNLKDVDVFDFFF